MTRYDDDYPDSDLADVATEATESDDPEKVWEFDRILTEKYVFREIDGEDRWEKAYLIQWEGYDIYESTWVLPRELVEGTDQALHDWQHESMMQLRNKKEPFDLEEFEVGQKEYREQKATEQAQRHHRRYVKRKRLGLPVPNTNANESSDSSSDDSSLLQGERNKLVASKRSIVRQPPSNSSSDDEKPLVKRAPAKKKTVAPKFMNQDDDTDEDERPLIERRRSAPAPAPAPVGLDRNKMLPTRRNPSALLPATKSTAVSSEEEELPITPAKRRKLSQDRKRNASATSLMPKPRSNEVETSVTAQSATILPGPDDNNDTRSAVEKVVKKPLQGIKSKPHLGVGIFRNWGEIKSRKTPWVIQSENQKTFKTRQLENWARKASAAKADKAPALQNTNPLSPLDQAQGDTATVFKVTERPKQHVSKLDASESAETSRQSMPNGRDSNDNGLLTCWYWATLGRCMRGVQCVFEHRFLGKVAFEENILTKDQATCFYWWTNGQCRKSDMQCRFAHHRTRYLAPGGGCNFVQRLTPDVGGKRPAGTNLGRPDGIEDGRSHPTSLNIKKPKHDAEVLPIPFSIVQMYPEQPVDGEIVGCWYHNFTTCIKSSKDCLFPHLETRWVAARSGRGSLERNLRGTAYWPRDEAESRRRANLAIDHGQAPENTSNVDPQTTEPERLQSPVAQNKAPTHIQNPPDEIQPPHFPSPPPSPHSPPSTTLPLLLSLDSPTGAIMPDTTLKLRIGNPHAGSSGEFLAKLSNFKFDAGDKAFPFFPRWLKFEHTCMLDDAKVMVQLEKYRSHGHGEVFGLEPKWEDECRNCAEFLQSHQAAYVCFLADYTIVLYPQGSEWQTYLKPNNPESSQASLRLQVLDPVPQPLKVKTQEKPSQAATESRPGSSVVTTSAYQSNCDGLDLSFLYKTFANETSKRVYIIFHSSAGPAVTGLCKRLLELDAKVYVSTTQGSWDYFRKNVCRGPTSGDGGVIILHESFDPRGCPRINGLQDALKNGHINIWRYKTPVQADQMVSVGRFNFSRLFPGGQATIIMDDCFAHQPHDVLPVIKKLEVRVKMVKTPTFLVGRPDLLGWVCSLTSKKGGDKGNTIEPIRTQVFEALFALWKRSEAQQDSAFHVVPLEIPDYDTLWQKDETAAGKCLAKAFSEWALDMMTDVRRIVLISMEKSSLREEWKNEYQHVCVMTPSAWCAEEDARYSRKS